MTTLILLANTKTKIRGTRNSPARAIFIETFFSREEKNDTMSLTTAGQEFRIFRVVTRCFRAVIQ